MKYSSDIINRISIPQQVLQTQVSGLYGSDLLQDLGDILGLYRMYDVSKEAEQTFQDLLKEGLEYQPADLEFRHAANLIDEEARFLFAQTPEFTIKYMVDSVDQSESLHQTFLDEVLQSTGFGKKLLAGAKDCFIGKRVALVLNISENSGFNVSFIPSYSFVYENDDDGNLNKLVIFYTVQDSRNKDDQRIFRKKYIIEDGKCLVSEEIFNGTGEVVETQLKDHDTKFSYIPAVIVLNEGLTGDLDGESDIEAVAGYEKWYNILANSDMNAERKSMNRITYTVDMSSASTKYLPTEPGSYWDLQSTTETNAQGQPRTGTVGTIEPDMSYSDALDRTLSRIKEIAYDTLKIPQLTPEKIQGIITSGKAMKVLYHGLEVRCKEKMLSWEPALIFMAQTIFEGALLFPDIASQYINGATLQRDAYFRITVEEKYSMPEYEDEEEERDLAKVNGQVMSRVSFLMKWEGMTKEQAEAEVQQIATEQAMLDTFFPGV